MLLNCLRKKNKGILFFVVLFIALMPSFAYAGFQADEQATIEVFERVSPSVVFIKNASLKWDLFLAYLYEVPQGAGSGFIWDKQGHIVTNFHVIYQADKIER
ncbi:MAG: S1C family serine protease [Candidatus Omnitrophica bacterium]|nr:S1C family serine protease [Candidatus Omnitrophota bacterium]